MDANPIWSIKLGVKSGTAWDSSQIPSFITAPLPDLATPYFATQSGKDNYCIQTVANNSVVMQREIINGAVGSWKRTDNFGCNTPADLASLLGGVMHIKTGSIPVNTPTELVGASGVYIIGMLSACIAFTVRYWIGGVNYLTEGGADQSFIITHADATNKITVETSVHDVEYIYIGF